MSDLAKQRSDSSVSVKRPSEFSKSTASLRGTDCPRANRRTSKSKTEHQSNKKQPDQASSGMKDQAVGNSKIGAAASEKSEERAPKKDSMDMMRRSCLVRGVSCLKSFSVAFRRFDKDFSREINFTEFKRGLQSFQIELDETKQRELFEQFDQDKSGTIDFQEFSGHLSPLIEGRRREAVIAIFNKLDQSGDGVIQTEDIFERFSKRAQKHPKFLEGEWTEKQVIVNMLAAFEEPESTDGELTRDEFIAYYSRVSAWVQDDCYFEDSLKACWDIE